MTGYLSAPGAGGSLQERCLKNLSYKAKRQQNPMPFSQHKNITGFPFWNDFLKSLNITNSVTDMQPIYIYTPLVKQAMSLRKFINFLCLTVL
jgi:hypothetical protein